MTQAGDALLRSVLDSPDYPVRVQPHIRLPSTKQIDARIKAQAARYLLWRQQYLRLKDHTGHGRWWSGPKPRKPVPPVTTTYDPETHALWFAQAVYHRTKHLVDQPTTQPPVRVHPSYVKTNPDPHAGLTIWAPSRGIHPRYGRLWQIDQALIMRFQLLRTVPSRNLVIVRGPTPEACHEFKAIQQEWVRFPATGNPHSIEGYHRWLVYDVAALRARNGD